MVSNGTSSALHSEQDLASIPTAQGGLSRLAIARLKSAGVPVEPLLGRAGLSVEDVARTLGMSERTLARKLSHEGLKFAEIFQQLRRDLAVRYLDDRKLHISKIAWLLGFNEVSAFTHACKRWTGKTPSQMPTAGAY